MGVVTEGYLYSSPPMLTQSGSRSGLLGPAQILEKACLFCI